MTASLNCVSLSAVMGNATEVTVACELRRQGSTWRCEVVDAPDHYRRLVDSRVTTFGYTWEPDVSLGRRFVLRAGDLWRAIAEVRRVLGPGFPLEEPEFYYLTEPPVPDGPGSRGEFSLIDLCDEHTHVTIDANCFCGSTTCDQEYLEALRASPLCVPDGVYAAYDRLFVELTDVAAIQAPDSFDALINLHPHLPLLQTFPKKVV